MELTKEKALELHRWRWTEMQKELGNRPGWVERLKFKDDWCAEHFPDEYIMHSCFLCEYARKFTKDGWSKDCSKCPIIWPCEQRDGHSHDDCDAPCEGDFIGDTIGYKYIPISEILALPEREMEDVPNG